MDITTMNWTRAKLWQKEKKKKKVVKYVIVPWQGYLLTYHEVPVPVAARSKA